MPCPHPYILLGLAGFWSLSREQVPLSRLPPCWWRCPTWLGLAPRPPHPPQTDWSGRRGWSRFAITKVSGKDVIRITMVDNTNNTMARVNKKQFSVSKRIIQIWGKIVEGLNKIKKFTFSWKISSKIILITMEINIFDHIYLIFLCKYHWVFFMEIHLFWVKLNFFVKIIQNNPSFPWQ